MIMCVDFCACIWSLPYGGVRATRDDDASVGEWPANEDERLSLSLTLLLCVCVCPVRAVVASALAARAPILFVPGKYVLTAAFGAAAEPPHTFRLKAASRSSRVSSR